MDNKEIDDIFGAIPVSGAEPLPAAEPAATPPPTPEPQNVAKPLRRPGRKKQDATGWLKVFFILLLSIAIGGILAAKYLLPFFITTIFCQNLGERLNRPVTIGVAEIDLTALSLTLGNGIVGADLGLPEDPFDPLLSFASINATLDRQALMRGKIKLKTLSLERPFIHLARGGEGDTGFHLFLARLIGDAKKAKSLAFGDLALLPRHVSELAITSGQIFIDDQSDGRQHRIDNINLSLPSLPPGDAGLQAGATPRFSATINGRPIDITGETKRDGKATVTTMPLQFSGIDLSSSLGREAIPGGNRLLSGKADLALNLILTTGKKIGENFRIEGVVRASDLAIKDAADNETTIRQLVAAGSLRPAQRLLALDSLELDGLVCQTARLADGGWRFPFPAAVPKDGAAGRWETSIKALAVRHGAISFTDSLTPNGYRNAWRDVQISLDNFSSIAGTESGYSIQGTGNNRTRYTSQGRIALNPFAISGMLVVDELDPAELAPYYQPELGTSRLLEAHVQNLSCKFACRPVAPGEPPAIVFSEANMTMEKVRVKGDGLEMAAFPSLAIKQASLDFSGRTLSLEEMTIPSMTAEFIDPTVRKKNRGAANSDQQPRWRVAIRTVDLERATVSIVGGSRPRQITLTRTQASNLGNDSSQPGRVAGLAGLSPTGAIQFTGTASLCPFSAELTATLSDINLADRPWFFDSWLRARVTSGILEGRGSLRLPGGSFAGSAAIKNLAIQLDGQPVIAARRVAADHLAWSEDPASLSVENLVAEAPSLDWTVTGKNLSTLRQLFTAPLDALSGKAFFSCAKATFDNGVITYSDKAMQPEFSATVNRMKGSASGVKNTAGNRLRFELNGFVNDTAQASLAGQLGLFDRELFADWSASVKDYELARLSSHLEAALGLPVNAGSLSLSSKYFQEKNEERAEHQLRVTGLQPSGRATSPRLGLTLALLSDQNGTLDLTLPVSGRVDAADFFHSRAILSQLRSLPLKAAVSPFSLLAPLAAEHPRDLDHILFGPGEAAPPQEAQKKITALAAALAARPGLVLTIQGAADMERDAETLARQQRQSRSNHSALTRETVLSKKFASAYGNEEIAGLSGSAPDSAAPAVPRKELEQLARQRAEAARQAMLQAGVKANQLELIGEALLIPASAGKPGSRVDFGLKIAAH